MQKIMIIGPGSVGVAAQISLLYPQYEVIGMADAEVVSEQLSYNYEPKDPYGSLPIIHSFDFAYNPAPEEDKWLQAQILSGQRFEILPVTLPEPGLICSASYWYEGAKENAWRAQQPRHRSQFTKSQPTAKARKATRRRAKAGRKASR